MCRSIYISLQAHIAAHLVEAQHGPYRIVVVVAGPPRGVPGEPRAPFVLVYPLQLLRTVNLSGCLCQRVIGGVWTDVVSGILATRLPVFLLVGGLEAARNNVANAPLAAVMPACLIVGTLEATQRIGGILAHQLHVHRLEATCCVNVNRG